MTRKIKIVNPDLTIRANNALAVETRTKGCSGYSFVEYDSDDIEEGYTQYYVNGRRVYGDSGDECWRYYDTDTIVADRYQDKVEEKFIKYPKKKLDKMNGDNYGRIHCYWCGTKLQKRYTKNKYYCRKCKK